MCACSVSAKSLITYDEHCLGESVGHADHVELGEDVTQGGRPRRGLGEGGGARVEARLAQEGLPPEGW